MVTNLDDAYRLLRELGAPQRLIEHAALVSAAATQLLDESRVLGVTLDERVVEFGAVLHDAGKVQHPEELSHPGALHEQAGEVLLLANGVQPEVARCCVSHGAWELRGASLEERTVALADKLWKGKREAELELLVVDEIALRLGVSRWDVFEQLDSRFEAIAEGGRKRVQRSVV